MMNEKELAYVESVVDELTELLDGCYQNILDDKDFEMPNFDEPLQRKPLNEKQTDLIVEIFTEPFAEIYRLEDGDDEKLNEQYEWLSEEKRKKLSPSRNTFRLCEIESLPSIFSHFLGGNEEKKPTTTQQQPDTQLL